jgi:hypothetical protein
MQSFSRSLSGVIIISADLSVLVNSVRILISVPPPDLCNLPTYLFTAMIDVLCGQKGLCSVCPVLGTAFETRIVLKGVVC